MELWGWCGWQRGGWVPSYDAISIRVKVNLNGGGEVGEREACFMSLLISAPKYVLPHLCKLHRFNFTEAIAACWLFYCMLLHAAAELNSTQIFVYLSFV